MFSRYHINRADDSVCVCKGAGGGGLSSQLPTFRSLAPTHRDKREGAGVHGDSRRKGEHNMLGLSRLEIFFKMSPTQDREGAGARFKLELTANKYSI